MNDEWEMSTSMSIGYASPLHFLAHVACVRSLGVWTTCGIPAKARDRVTELKTVTLLHPVILQCSLLLNGEVTSCSYRHR